MNENILMEQMADAMAKEVDKRLLALLLLQAKKHFSLEGSLECFQKSL